jgi:hypothetical protein
MLGRGQLTLKRWIARDRLEPGAVARVGEVVDVSNYLFWDLLLFLLCGR